MSIPPIIDQFAVPRPYRMSNVDSNFLYNPFLPNEVPGLAIWLDGNDVNGNGTIPTTGPIITWVNKVSNGIICSQPTTSFRPSYTGSSNIQFTNTNEGTTINGFEMNYPSSNNFETTYILFSYTPPAPPAEKSFMNLLYPNSNDGRQIYVDSNTTLVTDILGSGNRLSNGTVNSNVITLINVLVNNTNISHYVNGTFIETRGGTLFSKGNRTYLGTNAYGNNGLNGSIYEVLIYSNALPDTDRQKIESYLYHKWNNFSLDPSSPYYITTYSNYNYINLNSNLFQKPYGLTTNLPMLDSNNYSLIRNFIRFPNRLSNVSFS